MRALAAVAAVLLLTAACTSNSDEPPPSTTTTEVVDTAPPTTATATTVTTAPGRPRPTIAPEPADVTGGAARIGGVVVGPQGNVADARVRVERFVGEEVGTATVNAPNGQFTLNLVRGGQYRVHAWKAPDLILLEPQTFFLAADEIKTLELRLTRVAEANVRASTTPERLPPEEPFAINVFLFAAAVSDQGVLQAIPRSNEQLQMVVRSSVGLSGSDRASTDGGGNATFRARCLAAGPASVDVLVSTLRFTIQLPDCSR